MKMKILKKTTLSLLAVLIMASLAQAAPDSLRGDRPTMAILQWENNAGENYRDFVKGIPEMMMTNLGKSGRLRVIERLQVQRAYSHFALEESGLLSESQVKNLGTWLGADYIMLGSFTRMGEQIRLDTRVIDSRNGVLLAGETCSGSPSYALSLIDNLTDKILNHLAPDWKEPEKPAPCGRLKVSYKMFFSVLTSRPIYHQKCRIFIDDKPAAWSPVLNEESLVYVLLDTALATGSHVITPVHYYVDIQGNPAREMDLQPEPFFINVEANKILEISYRCKIGVEKDRFEKAEKEAVFIPKLF
jgi:TolB-like protein